MDFSSYLSRTTEMLNLLLTSMFLGGYISDSIRITVTDVYLMVHAHVLRKPTKDCCHPLQFSSNVHAFFKMTFTQHGFVEMKKREILSSVVQFISVCVPCCVSAFIVCSMDVLYI